MPIAHHGLERAELVVSVLLALGGGILLALAVAAVRRRLDLTSLLAAAITLALFVCVYSQLYIGFQ